MTIDEAIEYEKECAEKHEQIATWLEELKEYKLKEFQCHLAEQEGIGIGYKKAIDMFLEESIKSFADFELKYGSPTLDDCTMILRDAVEQLKAGV